MNLLIPFFSFDRRYVAAYPNCRRLILYLKKWFSCCQLYGPQAINAYAISWYAIFYLQIRGILPSVHAIIKLENKSKIVDGKYYLTLL